MDVAKWQKRLENNFTEYGVVGGHLLKIIEMEKAYGAFYAKTFRGQSVLIDAFQSFYIETIRSVQGWVANHGWPKEYENYALIFLLYVTTFRSFRACENLLTSGYPLDGYALLRDLKDRAILVCGIAHNLTSFPAIYGYSGKKAITDAIWRRIKEDRKKEERRIFNLIIRKHSNLPPHILEELAGWEQMFHEEVHGSKFTFFGEGGDWMRGKAQLSIGPVPRESSIALYMNRVVEVAWLLVRLFPYLQPTEGAFGPRWKEKHAILDDSLRFAEQGLSDIGKKIADAFIYFVNEKFSFADGFHYFEADGTGKK